MNRSIRSTALTLLSSGLLILGTTGCFSEETPDTDLRSAESESTDAGSEGVTETLSGEVEYLAPGEYIVNDQAFYVTEDTVILGGIYACSSGTPSVDDDGSGTVECALDEFEAALEAGTVVLAEVEVVDGKAQTITEYQEDAHLEPGGSDGSDGGTEDGNGDSGSGGFTGTLSGEVVYLAPGEYIVNDQAFFIGEDTVILGGIYACATEGGVGDDGSGTVECDSDTFEAALQGGTVILAEVVVSDGIAESITEYEA